MSNACIKWIVVALSAGFGFVFGEVVISDSFVTGVGDNIAPNLVSGTTTDVGNVTWRGDGNIRHNANYGGAAVPQNIASSNQRLYLDYAPIMDAGLITTLSVKALVADADWYDIGFAVDDGYLSSSTDAFWARVTGTSSGTATFYLKTNGVTAVLGSIDIKATMDDLIHFSLTYDAANNQVWGTVAGNKATNTQVSLSLGEYVPSFDQFTLEMRKEIGARSNAGYFDDVVVSAESVSSDFAASILSINAIDSETLKLVVETSGGTLSDHSVVTSSNLTSGVWESVAVSDDASHSYVISNLTYSSSEGSNRVVYVRPDLSSGFYAVQ